MTVRELIEELSGFDPDLKVAVKYRDDGGCYYGCDEDITPTVNGDDWYDQSVNKDVVLL